MEAGVGAAEPAGAIWEAGGTGVGVVVGFAGVAGAAGAVGEVDEAGVSANAWVAAVTIREATARRVRERMGKSAGAILTEGGENDGRRNQIGCRNGEAERKR